MESVFIIHLPILKNFWSKTKTKLLKYEKYEKIKKRCNEFLE
jgi:hypothetical protein